MKKNNYSEEEKHILLDAVTVSIKYGLENGRIMPVNAALYPKKLQEQRACFITLETNGKLRGCIGSLKPQRPLIEDVVYNAYCAAFCDPRFMPLTKKEFSQLTKHIYVLSPSEPITFSSEQDLLKQIRPNIDGLILSDQGCRGTFLPSVWQNLPNPKDFLDNLKTKAGLPEDYWSDTIKVERYTVETIE
jgi:hypothetical protein